MDRQWVLVALVPALFAIGIVLFFVLLPRESISLTNLIGYLSSLSTCVMVLVYILTTSRQLDTMRGQLKEMEFSRDVQIQPLPYFEKPKASLVLPRFYAGPETEFKKMKLMGMLHINFSVSNIGNGPAIAIDFLPVIFSGPRLGGQNILIEETISRRIDCVPSGERDAPIIAFHFNDEEHKALEALVRDTRLEFRCIVVFKNALGTAFKESVAFWMLIKTEKDMKIVKSSLKTTKTAPIDFATQIKQYKELMDVARKEDADKVFKSANEQLQRNFEGRKQIDLDVRIAWGSFDVAPISQLDYHNLLARKDELERKNREAIEACWEKDNE